MAVVTRIDDRINAFHRCRDLTVEPCGRLRIFRMSPRSSDMWPLTGPYVEEVWSEILGPTATLLVRRLGRCVDAGPSTRVSVDELGRSLGITGAMVVRALRQLHRHGLITFTPERQSIDVSGFAPSVPPRRLRRTGRASQSRLGKLGGAATSDGPQGGRTGHPRSRPIARSMPSTA
jgi:hypothetical protein